MDSEKPKEPELRFCHLCGKNKAADGIEKITLMRMGNQAIVYHGCHSCAIVIHNAMLIVGETIQREREKLEKLKAATEPSRIIIPNGIVPKNLKPN